MNCPKCNKKIPDDSQFCPFCGNITSPSQEVDSVRASLTNSQRYFDIDFGYSINNPIVVSSVETMGYYLSAFRTENGEKFSWVFESQDNNKAIIKYNLFVNGVIFESIYFNPNGYDSKYMPKGIVFNEHAFAAAKRGITEDELLKELEDKKEKEEAAIAQEKENQIKKEERKKERKNNRKKHTKLAIKISIPILIIALLVGLAFIFQDFIKYQIACYQLNSEEYEDAIEQFEKLGDYKDSKNKSDKAYYLLGEQQLANKEYDNAISSFNKAHDYENSNEEIVECRYLIAVKNFNDAKYTDAITIFKSITEYKDATKYLVKSYYYLMKNSYDIKDYEAAYENCKDFEIFAKVYGDSNELDISFIDDLKICYAEKLMQNKKSIDFITARDLLNTIKNSGSTDDRIAKDIEKCKLGIYNLKYNDAVNYISRGSFENALKAIDDLSKINDHPVNSTEQIRELKYQYVIEKADRFGELDELYARFKIGREYYDDETEAFYKYAKELAQENYKDTAALYKKLTSWNAVITINDSERDTETDMQTLSVSDTFYGHVTIYGGEYKQESTFSYKITFPDGDVLSGKWDFQMGYGDITWCSAYYDNPIYGTKGTAYFEVFDSNGNSIAKEQVRISY